MLHIPSCRCEACKENPMSGFPAFQPEPSFPSGEHWNVNPMKQDRWGLSEPGEAVPETMGQADPDSRYIAPPGYYDASDFGQAFVPGTVLPPPPSSSWEQVSASQIFQPAGLPPIPSQAIVAVAQQGQAPSPSTGIAPTLTFAQAQSVAASQGANLNADGTLSPSGAASPAPGIPATWWVAAALAYLILK
jgi:hypothetical protein